MSRMLTGSAALPENRTVFGHAQLQLAVQVNVEPHCAHVFDAVLGSHASPGSLTPLPQAPGVAVTVGVGVRVAVRVGVCVGVGV